MIIDWNLVTAVCAVLVMLATCIGRNGDCESESRFF
jgi:hypothetical protein